MGKNRKDEELAKLGLRYALDAGGDPRWMNWEGMTPFAHEFFERFARAVARQAVEDAIKVCESVNGDPTVGPYTGAEHCAKRIRRALLEDAR